MFKDIEKLLADFTPEEIYAEAMRIEEAKKAAAAKKSETKIANAREDVIDAFGAYVEALIDEKMPETLKKEFDDILQMYEKLIKSFDGVATKATDKAGSTHYNEDEKLNKFMREIGVKF